MRPSVLLATLATAAASCLAVALGPSPAAAATVPAGFTISNVASFSRATAVEWLPGGRIVVLEQSGRVRVGRPGGAFATALTLTGICTSSEKGLLGFTHDPGFLSNELVYVYYTRLAPEWPGGCANRVSRFRMVGDRIDRATEVVLLDNISARNGNHNGGDLDIGSDGYLYVSVGDAGSDPRGNSGSGGSNDAAQDVSLLNGKILRITLDGRPAPGNPFGGPGTARCAFRGNTASTPTTPCQEIYAWGLRNPFRFAFDRNDGSDRFFINDVGQRTREEVDQGGAGRNYGWPSYEGTCPQNQSTCGPHPAGLTPPILEYGRDRGTYITAGAFVPNGVWPKQYDGGYLFGDGGSGRVWLRRANGTVSFDAPFATGLWGIVDMTFGFDAQGRATLYYVLASGTLGAITGPVEPTSTVAGLKMVPITPFRAYDTGDAIGVARGHVVGGSTRLIDLDPPGAYPAALVNITIDAARGRGPVIAWGDRERKPATSNINADGPGAKVANAAIVPLSPDGTFLVEANTNTRLIVDVMAWFAPAGASSRDGRFEPLDPLRLVDSRIAAGTTLDSGSPNPWRRSANRYDIDVAGELGVPDDGRARAVVLSVVALGVPGADGGYAGVYPRGTTWGGTSNVNVIGDDRRANLVVVPLGADGGISIVTRNIANVVIDRLGYVTAGSAPSSSAGLYSSIAPTRFVDSRIPLGFGRLAAFTPATVTVPNGGIAPISAIVQNLTVTAAAGPGYASTYPASSSTPPTVSTVNVARPDQVRAALAFTTVPGNRRVTYLTAMPTDLVVDAVGVFSG